MSTRGRASTVEVKPPHGPARPAPLGDAVVTASRMPVLLLLVLAAPLHGQEPPNSGDTPPVDRRGETSARPSIEPEKIESEDEERARARAAFVEARGEFAAVTAAALTSEELTNWVKGLSLRVRLRRAEEDLRETRGSLRAAEASGRSETDEARRLADRAAALEADVRRLRSPDAETASLPVGGDTPDRETIRRWVENEMAEETARLADELTTRELEKRTKRLRRLANLTRAAEGFRRRRNPERAEDAPSPEVVPAGASLEPQGDLGPATTLPPGDELGPATTAPPVLPDPAEQNTDREPPADGSSEGEE